MFELFTIGHSSHTIKRFIDLLNAHQVRILADIRSFPGSRKHPQFGRVSLSQSLKDIGIDYVWLPRLGGRRNSVSPDSPNGGLEHPAFRSYADYMLTDDFIVGVKELFSQMSIGRVAVCCSEGWHVKCHRRLLSDYMVAAERVSVKHISSCVRADLHRPDSMLVVRNRNVIYPSPVAT